MTGSESVVGSARSTILFPSMSTSSSTSSKSGACPNSNEIYLFIFERIFLSKNILGIFDGDDSPLLPGFRGGRSGCVWDAFGKCLRNFCE